jgi:ribonuclease P protein component
MLPQSQRLRSNQQFQLVYRRGRSWAHPLAALHVARQPCNKRLGISVSKKVGGAVERNRVRRRIREILRAQLPCWKDGFDAIVVARPDAAKASFAELARALQELAQRARLVREPEAPPDTLYTMPAGGRPGRPAARAKPGAVVGDAPVREQ